MRNRSVCVQLDETQSMLKEFFTNFILRFFLHILTLDYESII